MDFRFIALHKNVNHPILSDNHPRNPKYTSANALMLSAKSVIPIRDPYPRHLRKKKSRHERRDLII